MEKPPKSADAAYQEKVAAAKEAYKAANERFVAKDTELTAQISKLWAARHERANWLHDQLAAAQKKMYKESATSSQHLALRPVERDADVEAELQRERAFGDAGQVPEDTSDRMSRDAAAKKPMPVPRPKELAAPAKPQRKVREPNRESLNALVSL